MFYEDVRTWEWECIFFYSAKTLVGHGLLTFEALRSHSDTPKSVGLPRTSPSQRPLPDSTQHTQQIDFHVPDGIRNLNPSKSTAADPRYRTSGHWDWRDVKIVRKITGEETLQFVITLVLLEWWKQGERNCSILYLVLLVNSTNKDLWPGKLKARFHFREEDIDSRIILKCVILVNNQLDDFKDARVLKILECNNKNWL